MYKGDRRDSNPRPSEPQSADIRFLVLPPVAQSPYLSRFLCSGLHTVSAYCALSGVRSSVKWHRPLPIPTGLIAPREDLARTTYGPRKVSPHPCLCAGLRSRLSFIHSALRINTTATRCSAASERPVRCARNL